MPHHLIDYVEPNDNYTAADWARDAGAKIIEIEGRGKVPEKRSIRSGKLLPSSRRPNRTEVEVVPTAVRPKIGRTCARSHASTMDVRTT